MPILNHLKIAIGADHAGYDYKEILKEHLAAHEIKDFGTYATDSVDYPDFAHPVANAVESGDFDFGILVCGSANGVAITANKHQQIRAAICWENEIAALARQHNNANIICIPARFVSTDLAKEMATTFLSTPFEGGRHENRVQKISC
ncbi:ribose 5-phosphate isomerase B [Pedobacter sp. Hv1]|uniref:ribose 5-phosphate isomerase B n=1 Tax=Pedobacter sp. Hv1 TaxID=1740090 RepID=UPI0006D89E7B|nr:ribose 5-phosphate isomerase B [Pedobacter sp. Hv1]KQB99560.1 ribose 5-phosphate isomerase [Pedobacter sp. Hv1]